MKLREMKPTIYCLLSIYYFEKLNTQDYYL